MLESGTGSGSLTHALARAIGPGGHVHTFEFHAERAREAEAEFKRHKLSGLVSIQQRNIEQLGFPEELHGSADGVFLDLPGPWKVMPVPSAAPGHAKWKEKTALRHSELDTQRSKIREFSSYSGCWMRSVG